MRITVRAGNAIQLPDETRNLKQKAYTARVAVAGHGGPPPNGGTADRSSEILVVVTRQGALSGSVEPLVTVAVPSLRYPELRALAEGSGSAALEGPRVELLGDFLHALVSRMPDMAAADLPALETAMRAVIGACLAPAVTKETCASRAAQRAKVEAIIRANLGSARLNVERLSALASISRSSLHRLFKEDGGAAVFIRRLRLAIAYERLGDEASCSHPISRVALECGFHSVPSFNRAFRAEFNCTPSEVRERIRLP